MEELKNQPCPVCKKKTLELSQSIKSIENFGDIFLLSMDCSDCNYHKSDIELNKPQAKKYSFDIENKKDLDTIVVKSAEAKIKVSQLKITIEPGATATGYVTTIKGLLSRFKRILEDRRDNSEDNKERKAAKNQLKKLWKVELGEEKLKIILEDPSGNSTIMG